MVAVRVRHQHVCETRRAKGRLQRFEMTRLAGARINQHGPPAGNEPRDVAGTGERAGVEGMDGNRIQNFKETVS